MEAAAEPDQDSAAARARDSEEVELAWAPEPQEAEALAQDSAEAERAQARERQEVESAQELAVMGVELAQAQGMAVQR